MARQRVYPDAAARQRAYRARKGACRGKPPQALLEQAATVLRAPLRVVDEEGRLLLDVGKDRDGLPLLRLYGPEGRLAVAMIGRLGGGMVAVYDSEGQPAALVLAGTNGGEIRCYDPDGQDCDRGLSAKTAPNKVSS